MDEAEKKGEVSQEEADQIIEDSDKGATAVATEEADDKATSEKPEGVEITRESGESQPPIQQHFGIRKRINKLNARNHEAVERADEAHARTGILEEKNKILEIALQQARENQSQVKQPDPADFDDGYTDPRFQEQQNAFNQEVIQREVSKQVQASTKTVEDNSSVHFQSQELEKKQLKHYERASEIGAKDYSETEDKAIEVLGNEVVNHIIDNFTDSQYLLYYLGKNPNEADRIAGLIQSKPILGIAEIGRLSSQLKVKPITNTTPNPDEELEGGESSATSSLQRQLDKLRDQVGKNPTQENMKKIITFKKRLREKDITLE